MKKYKLNQNDLQEHWDDEIRFIQKSVKEFDAGDEKEAKRLAATLRVLFHNTKQSKSIYSQIKPKMIFLSSGSPYMPSNLLTSWTLLSILGSHKGIEYHANLEVPWRCFYLMFNDWWNEIIFDDHKTRFSRCDIVKYIANQDGGAHVDPEMDGAFAELSKMNSLGWADSDGHVPSNNPAYQAIRVIANEILVSIDISKSGLKSRTKQKNRQIEMRVDNHGKRYKWSKTELKSSNETMQIVSRDRVEKRTLYFDEYKNGRKVEYIGS